MSSSSRTGDGEEDGQREKKLKKYLFSLSHVLEKERNDRKKKKRDKKYSPCAWCGKNTKIHGIGSHRCRRCAKIACRACFCAGQGVCHRCHPRQQCAVCGKKKKIYRAPPHHCKRCDRITCDACFTDVTMVCRPCDRIDPISCFCCDTRMTYLEQVHHCDCCWNDICETCSNDSFKWAAMDGMELCDTCVYSESCVNVPSEQGEEDRCAFREPG